MTIVLPVPDPAQQPAPEEDPLAALEPDPDPEPAEELLLAEVVVVVVVVVVVGQGPSAHTQRPAFRLLIRSKNTRVQGEGTIYAFFFYVLIICIVVRYFFDSIIFCLYIVPPHRCTVGKDTRSTRVRPGRDGWCSSRLRDPACSDTRL